MTIGILALQGGYAAHARMLDKLEVAWTYVRRPTDLVDINGLILPGGESSTFLKLAQENELFAALHQLKEKRMPVFGTCAGAILLAKQVISPDQVSLGLVDVTIKRNAYGRQLASRIVQGYCHLKNASLEMVFIRAPQICALEPHVQVIAECQGEVVCVQQNQYLLATFHPELTSDTTLHQHFINMTQV